MTGAPLSQPRRVPQADSTYARNLLRRVGRLLRDLLTTEGWTALSVGLALVVLSIGLGVQTLLSDGRSTLLMPAMGVVAIWISSYVRAGQWWTNLRFWRAAIVIVIAVPFVLVLSGQPADRVSLQGVGTLAQGLVTSLVWSGFGRSMRHLRSVKALWRLLLSATIGAVADVPFSPVAHVLVEGGGLEQVGLWILRGTVSVFTLLVVVHALGSRPRAVLERPSFAMSLGVFTATCLVYALGFQEQHSLYLMLPVTIWASSVLTIRGTAWHATLTILTTSYATLKQVGPFAGGSLPYLMFTAHSFMLVVVFVAMALVREREARAALTADIEARREKAAQQAELLQTLVHSVDDGVAIVDAAGRVIIANDAARELAGRTTETLDALFAAQPASGVPPLEAVLRGSAADTADISLTTEKGAELIVSVRAYALTGGGGQRAVAFFRDVTPERRRTEDLRAFAHTIAHDLRNPIAGICLSAELGLEAVAGEDLDEARMMLDRVLRTGDRMTTLINDIMDYRVTGDSALVRGPVRVDDLVHRVAEARQLSVGMPTLRLSIDAPVTIDGDRRLLERVMDNLLGNAVKYATPGCPPEVTVSAFDRGDGWVVVRVDDRGIGLPAGQEEMVFEEFHRVPEHARLCQGSGIGLSICRSVVQRHGGSIKATARAAGGTRFEMTLPSVARRMRTPAGPGAAETQPLPWRSVAKL